MVVVFVDGVGKADVVGVLVGVLVGSVELVFVPGLDELVELDELDEVEELPLSKK